ncbi:MAG: laccase domain-containing protein [Candidatus Babeliaceae bacterium]|nr:laccase domain-containing protein [Candidatus Babeliaceae bacterium]
MRDIKDNPGNPQVKGMFRLSKKDGFISLFGDKTIACNQRDFLDARSMDALSNQEPFSRLKKELGAKVLIFPYQRHGINSLDLLDHNTLKQAKQRHCEADIVITTLPGIAIGVMTADCLPLIFYDGTVPAIAAIHAGWRGSVNNIAHYAVSRFCKVCNTKPSSISVLFGPSAGVQSYSVGEEVIDALAPTSWYPHVIHQRNGPTFFDLSKLNELQLIETGINPAHIDRSHHIDTISSPNHFSYRRDRDMPAPYRQLTVAIFF